MKLISEQIEEVKVLTEEKNGKKHLYIEGVFLQGNLANRNRRYYDVDILDREVAKYNNTFVENNRALGELGHPEGPTINLDRVSHKIISLTREGNNFIGKAKILSTPMGIIAQNLIDEGVKLGVSSRGMGSLTEKNGINYVGEDFMLATAADIVADPSAPDAFVNGIMEGKEWIWDNGLIKEVTVNKIKKYLDESTRHNIEQRQLNAFEMYLKTL
jgi:hypothetical protein